MTAIKSKYDQIFLEPDYLPNDKEEYMSDKQLAFFRKKLLDMREECVQQSKSTLENLSSQTFDEPDLSDRASVETEINLELRGTGRNAKLIERIDNSLDRIEKGTYGYCEEFGIEIGLGRLMARPTATLCITAQEEHEKFEKTHNKIITANKNIIEEEKFLGNEE
jgi:DnaK suppressor protein